MHGGSTVVGVCGDPPPGLDAIIADAGARVSEGTVDAVLADDPEFVVAVGSDPFLDAARARPAVPLLPVEAGRGFRSVPADAVADAVARLLDDGGTTESLPVLRVEHDGDVVGRAVEDVTLLSAEVAHISEYRVTASGERVAQVRADGVVVSTPAGSLGYARRVGGPIVAPETDVGPVTPIAPFATDPDHWVVSLDDLSLTVERDETSVTLLVDEREMRTVGPGEPVDVAVDGTATLAVVPEGVQRFP